ncbi:MAG: putative sugar O-methyltransferase [Puniceicoccales bacterium]|jgi:putative sugar O-methyltransferase|nr:putative sugar O-methyltransferase [Puniceicoccales bacterium]
MTENSTMWDEICKNTFQTWDITTFRNNGPNNRLVTYNPKSHGVLFLKTILWQCVRSMNNHERSLLGKIKNRAFGRPISIKYDENMEVDLDYILCIKELCFLEEYLTKICSVIEIGGGYGRTAHGMLSLFPNIKTYYIIDLQPVLMLAKQFLEHVLPKSLLKKIFFIPVQSFNPLNIQADLCININSMQEMPKCVVKEYLLFIDKQCKYFYSNNTIGKFLPSMGGFEEVLSSEKAIQSGILKKYLNIFSDKERQLAQKEFLEAFKPSTRWTCLKHAECVPWPHYYQALYENHIK